MYAHTGRYRRYSLSADRRYQLPSYLERRKGKQKEHEYLYWEYPDAQIGLKAVRWGKWKGIISDIRKGNTVMELYDLDSDLQELHDVASEHPDIVEKLQHYMDISHETPENPKFRF